MSLKGKNTRIVSWNVNGLRACFKKGCWDWFQKTSPDIFCLQETKAHPDQLPPEVKSPKGYFCFFDYSKLRKGYSGVAIYSRKNPDSVEKGMGNKKFDKEGRLLTTYFGNLALINVYFPNGGGGPERLKFKLDFYEYFLSFAENLRALGFSIIICGDINTAHKEMDLARPKENSSRTGFLPVERAWIDRLVEKGYVDIFRYFYPTKNNSYTYWDMKTFARDRNVGWRIDYFFVTEDLTSSVVSTEILDKVYNSDHCPVTLNIRL